MRRYTTFVVIGYPIKVKDYIKYEAICDDRDEINGKMDRMVVSVGGDYFLGKIVSRVDDRNGINDNPNSEIDWEVVKAVADEGSLVNLGKPHVYKIETDENDKKIDED